MPELNRAKPAPPPPPADRHLWDFPLGQDFLWVLVVVAVIAFVWVAGEVLTPILAGIALAYMTFPLIEYVYERWHVGRGIIAGCLVGFAMLLVTVLLFVLTPQFARELAQFADAAPQYARGVVERLGYDADQLEAWLPAGEEAPPPATTPVQVTMPPQVTPLREGVVVDPEHLPLELPAATAPASQPATAPASQPAQVAEVADTLWTGIQRTWDFIATLVGSIAYAVVAVVLVVVTFFYFSINLHRTHHLKRYLPASHRDNLWGLLMRFDGVVSGYLRGQLLLSVIITALLWVGWSLVEVPYWFLLSIITGALCIIPYVGVAGAGLAIVIKAMHYSALDLDFSWWEVVILPGGVYLLVQGLESWLITPMIQSYTTRVHPVGVIIAVAIGGAMAGFLGMLLAVPAAASLRIVVTEVIGPQVARYMDRR